MAKRARAAGEHRAGTAKLLASLVCLMLAVLPTPAGAQDKDPVEDAVHALLRDKARHLGGDVGISILPSNGHFPSCPTPEAFLPRGRTELSAGRLSVGVRCGNGQARVRYVPVRLSVYGQYFEVTTELRRGDTITAQVVQRRKGDLSELPSGAVTDLKQATGGEASRRLTPGTVLRERHVRRTQLVERGQRVVVEHRGQGFVVSREGRAMESGSLGESIRVRLDRREVRTATVSAKGRLRTD